MTLAKIQDQRTEAVNRAPEAVQRALGRGDQRAVALRLGDRLELLRAADCANIQDAPNAREPRVSWSCVSKHGIVDGSHNVEFSAIAPRLGIKAGTTYVTDANPKQSEANVETIVNIAMGRDERMSPVELRDAAPSLYTHAELIYQLAELEREPLVGLYARTAFPVMTFNTWAGTWEMPTIQNTSPGYSQWSSLAPRARPQPINGEKRGYRGGRLEFHEAAASWDWLEVMRAAEARTRGALSYNFMMERLEEARRCLLRTENQVVMHGNEALGLKGVLSPGQVGGAAGMLTSGAPATFGAATAVQMRTMLLTGVQAILNNSTRAESPNTLAIGTAGWLAINTTLYADALSNTGRSVLELTLQALNRLGIDQINWLPEVEHDAGLIDGLKALGFTTAEATIYAGGYAEESVLITYDRNPRKGRIIVGRNIAAMPPERVKGETVTTLYASTGGFDVVRPKAFHVLTNV